MSSITQLPDTCPKLSSLFHACTSDECLQTVHKSRTALQQINTIKYAALALLGVTSTHAAQKWAELEIPSVLIGMTLVHPAGLREKGEPASERGGNNTCFLAGWRIFEEQWTMEAPTALDHKVSRTCTLHRILDLQVHSRF